MGRRSFITGVVVAAAVALTATSALASPRVLLVGTYHGIKGKYSTLQAALNAAKPYDYILIAPGDYKTPGNGYAPAGEDGEFPAADLVTTPDLTIIGMNRNKVILDGTKAGPACTDNIKDQNWGPETTGGPAGLNGLMVWKADDVTVDNLTACNFLGGSGGDGGTGNEIWWNGGASSGSIGGWGYSGNYLTTTSSLYDTNNASQELDEVTAAEYGIFSSNWDGGTWNHTYASNMNDSGYYIGACQQQCNQVLNHGWGEYNALGYSGSNSGGSLIIEHSQFDDNEDGFDTNSQNGDEPSPQNGTCPNGGVSPITDTHSCWVFFDNYVHNNNDPNVPAAGAAAAGPVGTGMTVSGGRDDTILDNTYANNGAWGLAIVPYPDSGPPCTGGVTDFSPVISCLFDEWGDAVIDNKFDNDGYFGNPTNGPFDTVNLLSGEPTDCFAGNQVTTPGSDDQLTGDSYYLEQHYPSCDGHDVLADLNPLFLDQVACDSGDAFVLNEALPCIGGKGYPTFTGLKNGLHPLPPAKELPSMPDVCGHVPANPWCAKAKTKKKKTPIVCKAAVVSISIAPAMYTERVTSVSVYRGGELIAHSDRGGSQAFAIKMGSLKTERVLVVEKVSVDHHVKLIRSTRVLHEC